MISDQSARDRFIQELDLNFSVQASAGAGKTTTLVERVATLAQRHPERLASVVLVTYTNRAADEMRQRLRAKLLSASKGTLPPALAHGLSRMFIGTIHSFCMSLIQEFALELGYASEMALLPDDDDLLREEWMELDPPETDEKWKTWLHRFLPERDLREMAFDASHRPIHWPRVLKRMSDSFDESLRRFRLNPDALDSVTSNNARSKETIRQVQQLWKSLVAQIEGSGFVSIPPFGKTGGKELIAAWPQATEPFLSLLTEMTAFEIARKAHHLQELRFRTGRLLFVDQIALAHRLLEFPIVRTELQKRNYRILLDEAQDTDPLQFELLIELARPIESIPFEWTSKTSAPRSGHFVMVGDPQQSIYRDRADLHFYRALHEKLGTAPAGEALSFSQTFRCRPNVVEFVNDRFNHVLDGDHGQVPYVPLVPTLNQGKGQVVYWTPPPIQGNADQKFRAEADWLITQIRNAGLERLRARSWNEVAILCPTRNWLERIQESCRRQHLPSVLHFETANTRFPEYLWLTALLTLHIDPENEFEIIGVLREIFGISDDAIYRSRFSNGDRVNPAPLTLAHASRHSGKIGEILSQLSKIRTQAIPLPLAAAVQLWATEIHLVSRLHALGDEGHRAVHGLEALLLESYPAQRQGLSMAEYVDRLQRGIEDQRPELPELGAEALQLMTIKKAKGLQWDAVLLPFLGHVNKEGGKSPLYPFFQWPPGREPHLGLSSGNVSPSFETWKEDDSTASTQERQRLYYVASTRPRHTLILTDDHHVWSSTHKDGTTKLASPNAYEALSGAAEKDSPGTSLDRSASHSQSELTAESLSSTASKSIPIPPLSSWPSTVKLEAVPQIIHRTPSAYKTKPEGFEEFPLPARLLGNEAAQYGTWWHEAMENLPWTGSDSEIQAFCKMALARLEKPESRTRGERELKQLLASPLKSEFSRAPMLREVPYTRRPAPHEVEEGQIDLLYQNPKKHWILLDWKTDRIEPSEAIESQLRERYTAQLHAYAEAVLPIGIRIQAIQIYHTPSGRVIDLIW